MKRDPQFMMAQRAPKRTVGGGERGGDGTPALRRVARRPGMRLRSTAARREGPGMIPGRGLRALPMNQEAIRECSGGTETASGATEKAHGRVAQ